MTREDWINQRATTCRHGGHCEWVACDKCNHYEPQPETITNSKCDDCISRQAVDELSKELVHTTKDKADFLCNFWEGLQKLPTATPKEKTEWIPISKRLPDFSQDVLLSLRSLDILTGFRAETEPYFYCRGIPGCYIEPKDILAWIPSPEPYESQESEDTDGNS